MVDKVKFRVNEGVTVTKEVFQGLEDLVVAMSLLITTFYNYDTLGHDKAPFEYYTRLVASAIILLFGVWLLVRAIRKK